MTRHGSAICALLFPLLIVATPLAQPSEGGAAGQGRQGGRPRPGRTSLHDARL